MVTTTYRHSIWPKQAWNSGKYELLPQNPAMFTCIVIMAVPRDASRPIAKSHSPHVTAISRALSRWFLVTQNCVDASFDWLRICLFDLVTWLELYSLERPEVTESNDVWHSSGWREEEEQKRLNCGLFLGKNGWKRKVKRSWNWQNVGLIFWDLF